MSVRVEIEALSDVASYFERLPQAASSAASMAINQVVKRQGMRLAQDAIYDQIAFPSGYLSGDRLTVARYASPGSLEAVIRARHRATSLSRFAGNAPIGGGQFVSGGGRSAVPPITVRVKSKSGGKVIRGAWLVRLNKGASFDQDNYNVGLAVRVRTGDVTGKWSTHQSWLVRPNDKGVGIALLYGPSVDQVFRDVSDTIAEPMGRLVVDEFFRQFNRITA